METNKSNKSIIKKISSKPIKKTLKEAIIMIVITLIITILFTYIYNWLIEEEFNGWDTLVISTVISTGAAAFIYEYSGINNILAESSIRYAQGSTLDKYKSRRDALLQECFYKLLNSRKYEDKHEQIHKNFKLLKVIVRHPGLMGKIGDMTTINAYELKEKYPKKIYAIEMIEKLPLDIIKSLNYIGDRLTENIIYDILIYGFDGYAVSGNILPSLSQESILRADLRGAEIKKNLIEDE